MWEVLLYTFLCADLAILKHTEVTEKCSLNLNHYVFNVPVPMYVSVCMCGYLRARACVCVCVCVLAVLEARRLLLAVDAFVLSSAETGASSSQ